MIIGKDHKSAIGTILERTTRTVILVPLITKDAPSVRKAFTKELKTLPSQMTKSLTYDRGKEMSEHKLFPKQTDFSKFTRKEIKHVQKLLNERPRKTLDWSTPKEKFKELLLR